MVEKTDKVGPQGTQVFELAEVEGMLIRKLEQQQPGKGGKPTLIGISKPFMGKKFFLTEDTYHIGRTPDCGIQLDEPSVSSPHAQLILRDGQWKIINLLSSNGTYVNGDKISTSDIYPGDRVRFGAVEMMYVETNSRKRKRKRRGLSVAHSVMLFCLVAIGALSAAFYFLY